MLYRLRWPAAKVVALTQVVIGDDFKHFMSTSTRRAACGCPLLAVVSHQGVLAVGLLSRHNGRSRGRTRMTGLGRKQTFTSYAWTAGDGRKKKNLNSESLFIEPAHKSTNQH
jgi:hypothetical protein